LGSKTLTAAAVALVLVCVAASSPWWMPPPLIEKLAGKRYSRKPPPWTEAAPRDAAEARRQDLRFLAALPDVDLTFTPQSRARFAAVLAELSTQAPNLSTTAFDLGIAHAVAQSGNAHTAVDHNLWRETLDRVPLSFAWFPEGLHIVRAAPEWDALLGARIEAIDGLAPEQWLQTLAQYIPGQPEHVRAVSPLLLESPEALHAMRDASDARRMQLQVTLDGAARQVDIGAGPPPVDPERLPSGGAARNVIPPASAWRGILARDKLPVSLRGADRLAYYETLRPGVLYLHLWRVSRDFGPEAAIAIRAAIASAPPPWHRIVLDLRYNGGGEYPAVYHALRALVDALAQDGRIAILTNDATFSGALITAALVKDFAGGRAVVMGDRAGDRLQFWAEGDDMVLPNSRIRVHTASGYHDFANGCHETRCYWPDFWFGVAVGGIDPDVTVPWPFSDYRRGIDPVLERALK
jgi:hypothetical protein